MIGNKEGEWHIKINESKKKITVHFYTKRQVNVALTVIKLAYPLEW